MSQLVCHDTACILLVITGTRLIVIQKPSLPVCDQTPVFSSPRGVVRYRHLVCNKNTNINDFCLEPNMRNC